MNIYIKKLLMFFFLVNISQQILKAKSIVIELAYKPSQETEEIGLVSLHSYYLDNQGHLLYQARMLDKLFEKKNVPFKLTITALFSTQQVFFKDVTLDLNCKYKASIKLRCDEFPNTSKFIFSLARHDLQLKYDDYHRELNLIDESTLVSTYKINGVKFHKWITEDPTDPTSSYPWWIQPLDIVNMGGYII